MNELLNNIGLLIQDKETLKEILPSMFTSISTIINSFITILVAIAGFTVNSMLNRRSLINEINKHKSNKQLDKLQETPIKILDCIDLVAKKDLIIFMSQLGDNEIEFRNKENLGSKLKPLINTIVAYGSKDAVQIVGLLNQELHALRLKYYKNNETRISIEDKSVLIAYLTLLLCQIKLDLTNTIIEPNLYYICRISEEQLRYFYPMMVKVNNDIVNRLGLNESFKIIYNDENIKISYTQIEKKVS